MSVQVGLALLAALAAPTCARPGEQPDGREAFVLADLRKPGVVPAYLIISPENAVAEVMPLDAEGRYTAQDMFVYRLEHQVGSARGELVWTGARSQYGGEPTMRALLGRAELTRDIFGASVPSPTEQGQEVPT